jgi:lysophospholipase L1-like esterase
MIDSNGHRLLPAEPKVAVLGDSVIAGIGVRGRSYARAVAKELNAAHLLQLARSTHTILDAVGHIDRLREFEPDLVIVSVGGSDGLVHAGVAMQKLLDRFAPKSWQGIEGLEPRPWFSDERMEKWRQKATSAAKLIVKRIGVKLTGGYRRVPPEQFKPAVEELFAGLDSLNCNIVIMGLPRADDKLWPGTNAGAPDYLGAILAGVRRYPNFFYVDPEPLVVRWDDFCVDHAHFNESGHAKVTAAILAELAPVRPAVNAS